MPEQNVPSPIESALHQQLFDQLQELHARRVAEQAPADQPTLTPEQQATLAGIEDPETSFLAFMRETAAGFEAIVPDGDETYIRANYRAFRETPIGEFMDVVYSTMTSGADVSEKGFDPEDEVRTLHGLLQAVRKQWQRNDAPPMQQLGSILVPAFVAMYSMPAGWEWKTDEYGLPRVPKFKRETPQQRLFRTAVTQLRQASLEENGDFFTYGEVRNKLQKKVGKENFAEKDMVPYLVLPENQPLRDGFAVLERRVVAKKLLKALASDKYDSDTFQDQLDFLDDLEEADEQTETKADEELEWDILPKGTLDELVERKPGKEDSRTKIEYDDPERLRWLARVALDWGPEAYVAVAPLDKRGKHKFYAAVLPQRLPNGEVIEHAVAESPLAGHDATYVFRAERGLENEEHPSFTWRGVFNRDKKHARGKGARRIMHNDNHAENVTEYLTRPEAKLDDKNYDR